MDNKSPVPNQIPQEQRICFGRQSLISYPQDSHLVFRLKSHSRPLPEEQKCLIDNLWIAYNKTPYHLEQNKKHFIAAMNSLATYFETPLRTFPFYILLRGPKPGLFLGLNEILEEIKDFPDPYYQGHNILSQAIDDAAQRIGPNYYTSPSIRLAPSIPVAPAPPKKEVERLFCEQCDMMMSTMQKLNERDKANTTEIKDLQSRITIQEQQIRDLQQKSTVPLSHMPSLYSDRLIPILPLSTTDKKGKGSLTEKPSLPKQLSLRPQSATSFLTSLTRNLPPVPSIQLAPCSIIKESLQLDPPSQTITPSPRSSSQQTSKSSQTPETSASQGIPPTS